MTRGTLNGAPSLDLPTGESLAIATNDNPLHIVLTLSQDRQLLWQSDPLELAPEPSRTRSTSTIADFIGIDWPAAGAVVVLGYSRAVLLEKASGTLLATYSLDFTGKESLEQVGLQLSESGKRLLITSTKRIWVIDASLETILRYEPRFMLAGMPTGGDSTVIVQEYDFDTEPEVVRQVLDL